MRIEEILDYKLKKLLADKANSVGDEDKKFILAQAKVKIQTYCHRRDIPKEAYYIWADIAIEILKTLNKSLFEKEVSEEDLLNKITSVKAGDTSINVGEVNTNIDTGYRPNEADDAILNSFAKQLQAFRKLSCGCGDGLCGD